MTIATNPAVTGISASAVLMGGSSTTAPVSGLANVNTTPVGNVGTGVDTLITYSLPANSLNAAGKGVKITAWGTTANNANAKTLILNFGSAAILTNALTASVAGSWRVEAVVFSTGTDAQRYSSALATLGAVGVALNDVESGTATEDDGAAIVIKCTGEATANDDIIQAGLMVEFLG